MLDSIEVDNKTNLVLDMLKVLFQARVLELCS